MAESNGAARSLSERGLQALKWTYLGNAVRAGSQLVIGVILSRLLGPDAFGTVAIAWIVIGFGMLVADAGFGTAIIQRQTLTERDIRFAFTVQVCVGAALCILVAAMGGAFAAFFGRPGAAPVVRVMGMLFLLQSFGLTGLALLRRALNYRAAQRISIVSYVLGYLFVGVPCAWLGLGPWALVAAQLLQAAIASVTAIVVTRMPIRPAFSASSSGMLAFGGWIIGANASSWAISNLDGLLVGRVLGVASLGVYNRAMTLLAGPMTAVTGGMQNVLFAACSRAQHESATLRRAYLAAIAAVSFICFPSFITIAFVPRTVILGLLGDKWASAIDILGPIALAMPVNAVLAMAGPVLTAIGRVRVELTVQLIAIAIMLPLVHGLLQVSLRAAAWGMLGIYVLRGALLLSAAGASLGVRWRDVALALSWPLACAAAAAGATWTCDAALSGVAALPRLAIDGVVALVALAAMARGFARRMLQGPHGYFLHGGERLPQAIRGWLRLTGS